MAIGTHVYDETAKALSDPRLSVLATASRPLSSYLDELEARLSDAHEAVTELAHRLAPALVDPPLDATSPLAPTLTSGRSDVSRRVEDLIDAASRLESRVRAITDRVDL